MLSGFIKLIDSDKEVQLEIFIWYLIVEFCFDILFIMISTVAGQGMDTLQCTLPKGIWLSFDFDDSHPVRFTVHIDSFVLLSVHC